MKKILLSLIIFAFASIALSTSVFAAPKNKIQVMARNTVITKVSIMPCTSSSCSGSGWLRTLRVDGKNFTSKARVGVIDGTRIYSEKTSFNNSPKDAQYVGGNRKTTIITDFYNLPACKTYGVQVYFPDGSFVNKSAAFSLPCN